MSPVPPIDKNFDKINQNDSVNSNPTLSENNQNLNEDNEFEVIENTDIENAYDPIPQENFNQENEVVIDNDDDDDSEYSDDDDSVEIDPDEHFELLASSRVGDKSENNKNTSNNAVSYNNSYLFDQDVFERKNTLECEEIYIDDSKSQTINNLMSNFKLPESSIPEWAKLVPENVWKKNLLDSLNAKKTDLFDLKKNEEI